MRRDLSPLSLSLLPLSLLPLALLAALASSACVSAQDYAELEADLAKARQELTASRGDTQELRVALEETENTLGVLSADIEDLAQELLEAEQRAAEAETELAGVLKDKSALNESIADMQVALAELKHQRAKAEVRAGLYRAVLSKFKGMIDNGKLEVRLVDGRMVLQLQTDILFGSGSADLSDEGAAVIREVGGLLADFADRDFQVEGHTDNVPISTKAYPSNWELASARSITVVKEMVEAGLAAKRVSAAAYADTQPTASNETREGRARNRRIEIVIVPDLSDLPGAEEIEQMFESNQPEA